MEKLIENAFYLYELKLFETKILEYEGYTTEVTRVPGGWIMDGTFVPFNNEFMELGYTERTERIRLICPNCYTESYPKLQYKFRGNKYKCDCGFFMTYEEK
jgi:hypothetical protein